MVPFKQTGSRKRRGEKKEKSLSEAFSRYRYVIFQVALSWKTDMIIDQEWEQRISPSIRRRKKGGGRGAGGKEASTPILRVG